MKKYLFLFLAAVGSIYAGGLTLNDCVNEALQNNKEVAIVKAAWDAGKARTNLVKAAYFPQINASLSYSRRVSPLSLSFGDNIPSIPGLGDTIDAASYTAGLSAQMMLWDFGRTGSGEKQAFAAEQSAKLRYEKKKQEVAYNVKKSYYSVLQAKSLAELSGSILKEMKNLYESVRERKAQGLATAVDVLNAESEYLKAEGDATKAKRQAELALDSLALSMGKNTGESPALSGEEILKVEEFPLGLKNFEECSAAALNSRLDFKEAELQIEAAEASVAAAYADWLPTFSGNASYDYSSSKFPPDKASYSYGLNFSVPVFSGFSSSAKLSAAESDQRSASASRETLKQSLLAQIKSNYFKALNDKEYSRVVSKKVQYLNKNYEAVNAKYGVGLATLTELIDAEVKKASGEVENRQSLFNYWLSVNELEYSIGGKVK